MHRNTVLYRIQRIQKLTRLDLQNPLDQNLMCLPSCGITSSRTRVYER
jgi:sugar diacid utilization regulator